MPTYKCWASGEGHTVSDAREIDHQNARWAAQEFAEAWFLDELKTSGEEEDLLGFEVSTIKIGEEPQKLRKYNVDVELNISSVATRAGEDDGL